MLENELSSESFSLVAEEVSVNAFARLSRDMQMLYSFLPVERSLKLKFFRIQEIFGRKVARKHYSVLQNL